LVGRKRILPEGTATAVAPDEDNNTNLPRDEFTPEELAFIESGPVQTELVVISDSEGEEIEIRRPITNKAKEQ